MNHSTLQSRKLIKVHLFHFALHTTFQLKMNVEQTNLKSENGNDKNPCFMI